MSWTDSHCHVPYQGLGTEAIEAAQAAGVTRMVDVGTDAGQSELAIEVAAAHDGVWATVGLHPHEASQGVDSIVALLGSDKVGREKVVAVGECGLDYHYDHSPRPVQREVFAAQVALARQYDLALVIHTREAWDDTFAILAAEAPPDRVVFHCFTGGPPEARRCLDLGAYLSFSGVVTFKSAGEVRAAAVLCPLDKQLVETDAPYLAPVPHRGRTNQPAWVPLVGAAVAVARGVAVEEVEDATWRGAEAAFALLR
ncbi:MAG: TatD family hydrolase [Acidimicrobiales bacterium]